MGIRNSSVNHDNKRSNGSRRGAALSKASSKAVKYDHNKVDPTLLPMSALKVAAVALMYGEKKYGRNNYRKLDNRAFRYLKAAMRHLMDHSEEMDLTGEVAIDEESGLPHAVLGTASCLMMLDALGLDYAALLAGMKDPPKAKK